LLSDWGPRRRALRRDRARARARRRIRAGDAVPPAAVPGYRLHVESARLGVRTRRAGQPRKQRRGGARRALLAGAGQPDPVARSPTQRVSRARQAARGRGLRLLQRAAAVEPQFPSAVAATELGGERLRRAGGGEPEPEIGRWQAVGSRLAARPRLRRPWWGWVARGCRPILSPCASP